MKPRGDAAKLLRSHRLLDHLTSKGQRRPQICADRCRSRTSQEQSRSYGPRISSSV